MNLFKLLEFKRKLEVLVLWKTFLNYIAGLRKEKKDKNRAKNNHFLAN